MTTTVIKFITSPEQVTWLPKPKERDLPKNEVHIWLANLELEIYGMSKFLRDLSLTERTRAQNLRFDHDRRRFVLGKGILRNLVSTYIDVPANEIQFSTGPSGKPEISDRFQDHENPIHFNQAHSGHLGIYAFTRSRRIGVDIEEVRPFPDMDQLAPLLFSPRELEAFQSLNADEKQPAFFGAWTHKEAFVKALGKGLTVPLSQFEVSQMPGNIARIAQNENKAEQVSEWYVKDISVSAQFSAAVCVEGEDWKLRCLKW